MNLEFMKDDTFFLFSSFSITNRILINSSLVLTMIGQFLLVKKHISHLTVSGTEQSINYKYCQTEPHFRLNLEWVRIIVAGLKLNYQLSSPIHQKTVDK